MPVFRSADPEEVRAVWEAIRFVTHQRQAADVFRLGKIVGRNLSIDQDEAEQLVRKCHKDGLLMQVIAVGARGKKRGVESQTYKIPTEIPSLPKHDWYCYECHLAGDVTACEGCHRVFHSTCIKSNMSFMNNLKPALNSSVNGSRSGTPSKHVNGVSNESHDDKDIDSDDSDVVMIVEEYKSDSESHDKPNSTSDNDSSTLKEEKNDPVLENGDSKVSSASSITIKLEESVKTETKPIPVLPVAKFSEDEKKNDLDDNKDEDDEEDKFASHVSIDTHCYVCRMAHLEQKNGGLADCTFKELNYLLQFTYDRIHSWLPDETLSDVIPTGKAPITSSDEAWCSLYLIRGFPMTLKKIHDKIRRGAYESLTGFSADVHDIVHHIGILVGVSSQQMEAAKYMLNDASFDLSEIRQCRDCYRHSNEKSDPAWFAKPCFPRHELVFAKQKGYNYWPAKVIKITSDGNYDVRFFGGKHFRAMIDPLNVKPIDTPFKDMQLIKRSVSLNKALEELQKHQNLLNNPPGMFTYNSEQSKLSEKAEESDTVNDDTVINPTSPTKKKKNNRKSKTPNNVNNSVNKLIPRVKLTRTLQVEVSNNSNSNKPKPRMTRNSLVTAPDMSVYDISTVDEDSVPDEKKSVKKKDSKKQNKKSVNKEEMQKGKRSCGPISDESADVEVVKLCNSSDEEGNVITMKTIDYIGESNYSSTPTRVQAQSSSSSSQEALISSTQEIPSTSNSNPVSLSRSGRSAILTRSNEAPRLDRGAPCGGVSRRENFERIKMEVEQAPSSKEAARIAHKALLMENERWERELQSMVDEQIKTTLFEAKRRQWCYHCGDEAIYYCCWNTAYCSTTCQQQHWQAEHKRACRRKR